MCTLIAIHRGDPGQRPSQDASLIVAANRDEYFDRPAEGPAIRELDGRRVLAPLDLRAGGTWLGVNEDSVFAAVTNLRCESPDPQRRSRGWIVMDALRQPTAALAADMLKALPEETYNPFQCLVADGNQAFHVVYRDRPRLHTLAPGVHVIGNVDPREEPAPKVQRIRDRVAGFDTLETEVALTELARVCAEHESGDAGLGSTCVHLGSRGSGGSTGGESTEEQSAAGGYGTRSSVLLALPAPPDRRFEGRGEAEQARGRGRLLVADGAPCQTRYEDRTELLAHLRAGENVMGNRS